MGSIVGLHGPAGAGKDTAAAESIRIRGQGRRLAFADKLKNVCLEVFADYGVNFGNFGKGRPIGNVQIDQHLTHLEDLLGVQLRAHGRLAATNRQLLYLVATVYVREDYPDYWVDALQLPDTDDDIYVTDVRFPNEALRIANLGGWLVGVNRPNSLVPSCMSDGQHIMVHHVLHNTGTREDLGRELSAFLDCGGE